MTRVAMVAPASPSRPMNRTVAMEDMPMLTTLLPMRMVDSRASYLSARARVVSARLSPITAMVLSRVRLREEKAVSVAEK